MGVLYRTVCSTLRGVIRGDEPLVQHLMVRIENNMMQLRHHPVPLLREGEVLVNEQGSGLDTPECPLLSATVEDLLERYLTDANLIAKGQGQ